MANAARVEASPFDLPPDPEEQKQLLTNALRMVEGFALYFVVSEPSRVRPQLMDEIEARLAGKTVQRVAVPKGTPNLLHLLEEQLTDPLSDVVFVYGLENSISGSAEPRSHPLLLNLNATRNNLFALLPRPLVLWVPAFVMTAILQAAPDFISVRSGVYTFTLTPEERREMTEAFLTIGQSRILGMAQTERDARIAEMKHLLSEIRALPEDERNPVDEASVLNQLALAHHSLGEYAEAEPLYKQALEMRQAALPEGHPDIAASLNNLAALYKSQGRYEEAEPLYKQALEIDQKSLPPNHPNLAIDFNNLAELYRSQGRYEEAEPLYKQALEMRQAALPEGHSDIAISLNNLAALYDSQGRYEEAEPLYKQALEILIRSLGENHPNTRIVAQNWHLFRSK
jgi:Flp pilus assembly protein TadD, contains TPR repeats